MTCCPGCGRTDKAGITHVCPPIGEPTITVQPSRWRWVNGYDGFGLQLEMKTLGPTCPCCWRTDGSHSLGCPVEAYIEASK